MNSIILKRTVSSIFFSGLGMWITGGLYHNLLLPIINNKNEPHHEGLGMVLLAYFILAACMYLIYQFNTLKDSIKKGCLIGMLVGFLWVFPHGLSMAATHQTSILYEFKNALYHLVEQGIGGIIIYYVGKYFSTTQKSSRN